MYNQKLQNGGQCTMFDKILPKTPEPEPPTPLETDDFKYLFIKNLKEIIPVLKEAKVTRIKFDSGFQGGMEINFLNDYISEDEPLSEERKQFNKEADATVAKYEMLKQNKKLEDEIADTLHITDPLAYEDALMNNEISAEEKF